MQYIQECCEAHGGEIINQLKENGFSNNQIIAFLPEAISNLMALNKNNNASYIIDSLLLADPYNLLDEQNIYRLMQEKGLDSVQITAGFRVIIPYFLKSFLKLKYAPKPFLVNI